MNLTNLSPCRSTLAIALTFLLFSEASFGGVIEISYSGIVELANGNGVVTLPNNEWALGAFPVTVNVGDRVSGRMQLDSSSSMYVDSGNPTINARYINTSNAQIETSINGLYWSASNSLYTTIWRIGSTGNEWNTINFSASSQTYNRFASISAEPTWTHFEQDLGGDKIIEIEFGFGNKDVNTTVSMLNSLSMPASRSDINLGSPGEFYGWGLIDSAVGMPTNWGPYKVDWLIYYSIDSITISEGNSAPPQLNELGQMAECAYTGNCLIPGYQTVSIGTLAQAPATFGAVALVNNATNQVVLSIAGSNDSTDWLKVNPTFIDRNGEPTDAFRDYVKASANALKELSGLYPAAEITLTGHSMGGALAQLLARETGFPATTFNAPGAAQAIPYLGAELAGLNSLTNPVGSVGVTNYRIYGDLVSTVGTQVGLTVTFTPPISSALIDSFPGGTAKPMHEMLFVNERIINNAPTTGNIGPVFSETVGDFFFDLYGGIFSPKKLIKPITSAVIAGQQIWIDPENFDLYQFATDPGSPKIRSVILPYVIQFDALFDLQIMNNDEWLSLGYFGELDEYDFGLDGIDMFRFFVLNSLTYQPPGYIEPLTFGMTFVSDGIMSGVVTAINTQYASSVPEPKIFALISMAFFALVMSRRRILRLTA